MAEVLELKAARGARGTVRLPGSKSISNRVLLLASLAEGETDVTGLLDAEDTRVMREALARLGVALTEHGKGIKVRGVGGTFRTKKADLFLGNAGTALRPLTAALALSSGEYFVSGVARMHERPIADLVDALRSIGARIDYRENDGYPPLMIHPAKINVARPVAVRGDVSSQFLTALLMALPLTGMPAIIEVQGELISKPYVEITLNVMQRFGIQVERTGWSRFVIPSADYLSPGAIFVEGDASSASYFLAAGALGGGPVRVEGVGRGSIQGDVRFAEVLQAMGAQVTMGEGWIECAGKGKLRAIDIDLNHIPDAAMTAAVLALFADGPSTLRNIASWRVKETDRLAAMATELRKLGATVEEGSDHLRITPAKVKPGVAIDTYDDHRMAMSFSLVALGGVPVKINDPQCVAKTFPDYFRELETIRA
ncbi:MAG TPA: 3-phosphoshikimate 1-carboxyvinyltransferase [Burkholderiales bacterium]|jgi:3-phosphoshikimate 1-carboxyvinyltransferase|nr:3-phosphoshikimate 1-carboxyvinyltransferase [Burkholderiales bacterium]